MNPFLNTKRKRQVMQNVKYIRLAGGAQRLVLRSKFERHMINAAIVAAVLALSALFAASTAFITHMVGVVSQ